MRRFFALLLVFPLLTIAVTFAQQKTVSGSAPASKAPDYSGMYSFLRDGEFVQVTVEDQGHVTGFVSRYGDLDSDRGQFLDQFFKTAKLDGKNLSFTTETVHGVWFEFSGTVDRGPGKNPGEEAYYVLNGKLTEYSTDSNKKISSKSRDVAFREFPEDVAPGRSSKD
jgi:hypothetical protein